MTDLRYSTGSAELLRLIDEIEGSGGLYLMHANPDIQGRQLGIKKTATVIAALRQAEGMRDAAQGQSGCGDPSCKDPNCTYGKGKPRCQNCGDPIAHGIYCGMCREMGCSDPAYTAMDPTNHHNALKCPHCNPDDAVRRAVIEECARELETSYPDHAWLNAACAAVRSLSIPSTPCGGGQ